MIGIKEFTHILFKFEEKFKELCDVNRFLSECFDFNLNLPSIKIKIEL